MNINLNKKYIYAKYLLSIFTLISIGCLMSCSASAAITHNNNSERYFKQEQYDLAIIEFNEAIKLNPQSEVAYNNRDSAYNKRVKWPPLSGQVNQSQ
jgi:tetratricopeptide (TPR) repeat protein